MFDSWNTQHINKRSFKTLHDNAMMGCCQVAIHNTMTETMLGRVGVAATQLVTVLELVTGCHAALSRVTGHASETIIREASYFSQDQLTRQYSRKINC